MPILKKYPLQFLLLLVAVYWFTFNISFIAQPPIWDTATAVFPAAIYLANHSFNLAELLTQPGWIDAGPNNYPFSPLVWWSAAVMALNFTPKTTFIILHLTQLFLVLATSAILWNQTNFCTMKLRIVIIGLTLATPIFVVQTGYMYSEILICLLSLLILWAASSQRYVLIGVIGTLIVLVKPVGVIPLASVAALLFIRRKQHWWKKIIWATTPGLIALVPAILMQAGAGAPENYITTMQDTFIRIKLIPDVMLIICVSLAIGFLVIIREFRGIEHPLSVLFSALMIWFGFGFYILVPTVSLFWFCLRYLIQFLPFAFILIVNSLSRTSLSTTSLTIVAGICTIFQLINVFGLFYPPLPGPSFSMAERDLGYRDYFDFQRQLITEAKYLESDSPKYVSREMFYFLTSPGIGYVSEPLDNVNFALTTLKEPPYLPDLPNKFHIIYSYPDHGGLQLIKVMREVDSCSHCIARQKEIHHQNYTGFIYEVSQQRPN